MSGMFLAVSLPTAAVNLQGEEVEFFCCCLMLLPDERFVWQGGREGGAVHMSWKIYLEFEWDDFGRSRGGSLEERRGL